MNFLSKLRTLEPELCAAIEQRSRSLGLSRLESSHRIRFRGALGFSLFWIYEKDERILFAAHTAIDGNRSHTKKFYPFVAAYQSHIDLASLALFGWPEMDAVRTLHLCRIFLDIDELKDTYVVTLIKASKK